MSLLWRDAQLWWRALEAPCGGTSITLVQNSVSLERKRRGSRLTNGGEIEWNWWLLARRVVMYRTWSRVLPWASVTRWGLCLLTSPSMLLFRRVVLLLKSKNFGVKNTSAGFGWGLALLAQYFKTRKMSWFLKETTLNLCQIQQATTVKNKNIRKFLDDIYVSEKGTVQQADE